MDRRRPRSQPQQLALPDVRAEWRLDERTRKLGLRGVADARAAVLAARQRMAA
jgi:hypothetical protein